MNTKYKWVLVLAVTAIALIYGFNEPRIGVTFKKGPYEGMVYIPGGTFVMGQADQDISVTQIAQSRQVTISPFYMDATEVTNTRYKEFVHWVRDSVLIHNYLPQYLTQNAAGEEFIDWKEFRRSAPWKSPDPAIRQTVSQMFYQGEDKLFGKNEYDVRLLRYRQEWYDLRAAIVGRNDSSKRRSDFIRREITPIYPDTTVWVGDFSYAQNEPMVQGYFSHPSFDNYPVVGVSWKQAEAFNHWKTKMFEDQQRGRKERDRTEIMPYTLPSEAEWEYAARGGKVGMPYPWGGPSPRNGGGQLLANFKPGRGDYIEDGYAYTSPVGYFSNKYYPNDYGLWDMAGNVAEWTSSSFNESSSSFVHDLNPTYRYDAADSDPQALKRKAVRGGSWKDVGFFLQNSVRTYEYQDSSKSYIGFRSISRAVGAGGN